MAAFSAKPLWRGGFERRGNLWTRRVASARAWIHEMVDQRAHAVFVPFVTWSTNPQYLIPPLEIFRKKCQLWGRRQETRASRAQLDWKKEHLQGVRCTCARCDKLELTCSRISFLGGLPRCEATQVRGKGHAVCTTPKYSSGQLTRVRALYVRHRLLGHRTSVSRESRGGPLG